ncbi:coiled-coil domain-containing protein 158-like isoform X2 [Parambassis ranga]|uniref:Coiled-coil domain-containing protein 158-like isoform X2 n=1 Tax=Parambassis ranga TaxID=210632 RepID=A0A6P7J0R3_9TELE|nr:coiled-coil domain-containing protein 158-like isoform X2 [Parambassis ranga]
MALLLVSKAMSSEPRSSGQYDSTFKNATAATHGAPLQLRFDSLTLEELSEELDRRTKETQRLQDEVENATRAALERFRCTTGINSLSEQSYHDDDSLGNSTHQPGTTEPTVCLQDSLSQVVAQRDTSSPGEKTPRSQELVNLQTKLQKVQMEKDTLSDLRLKDSTKHVDQMEKMLCLLEELQDIKRSADKRLQETEDEALALNGKVQTLEQTIKELYHTLYEKQCGHNPVTKSPTSPTQLSLAPAVNEDLNDETGQLQERCSLFKHQESRANQQNRLEDLITSFGQEMAMLTDKLSSSKDSSVNLSVKVQLLKTLAQRQASFQECQISELESTLSSHKNKICCLEQQLTEARTQLCDAQRENDQLLQQAKELQAQLGQLKRCREQQQYEAQEEVRVLRGQLEVAREQLCKAGEENTVLRVKVEQRTQEGRQSQELLQEKDKELQLRQQETQQHYAKLAEARSQCQTLQAEQETLRLKLSDSEKTIDVLKSRMESSIQMTVQHSHTVDSLQQENSLLSNQLNQHKLEIHQLRTEIEHRNSDMAAAELERRQLQASVTEQNQRIWEETLEKQQLTAQLELQRVQLLSITKEHKELQQLHSCKNEEQEGVVLKLQCQLRSAHDELDEMRSTLRTLKGTDGHGLQVALDMQKEITAKRQQVDCLHGRLRHLEERVEKLQQDKHYQNLETQHQLQELTLVREEKRQLVNELEALRTRDQQLRDRISELEAILHKMSESFTNCQDFIQLQEQQFFRLKLKHALDLKELKGQNLHAAVRVPPPDPECPTPSVHTTPPSSQHASNTQIKSKRQQRSSACELRSLVEEIRGVISENHRPHTVNGTAGSGFHRRRSAPERVDRTAFTDQAEGVKAESRQRRRTCDSELRLLRTAELNGKTISKSFSEGHVVPGPAEYMSSTQCLFLGRRSPVHTLLTSEPTS